MTMKIKRIKKEKTFFKREEKPDFYKMLQSQCEIAAGSIRTLLKFMNTPQPELAAKIDSYQVKGDRIRRQLIDYVENNFISPLDRHDIFAVSRMIDDLTDKTGDLKDFLQYFDYMPDSIHLEMIAVISESVDALEQSLKKWNSASIDEFWPELIKVKNNKDIVRRLYWETIDTITDAEFSLHDGTVKREFSKELYMLSHKTGKVGDRLSDIRIKAIK